MKTKNYPIYIGKVTPHTLINQDAKFGQIYFLII